MKKVKKKDLFFPVSQLKKKNAKIRCERAGCTITHFSRFRLLDYFLVTFLSNINIFCLQSQWNKAANDCVWHFFRLNALIEKNPN